MNKYNGLDYFRVIAVILVIAIHTSPLTSVSVIGDFILTRAVARIAVPFFFMVTGFFVLPKLLDDKENSNINLLAFLKKTSLLYLLSMFIYLPINIYAGYFNDSFTIMMLVKDIILNGTFYHLWYLPASILGVLLVYGISRKLKIKTLSGVVAFLYLMGLFGDSYYGLIKNTPLISVFYTFLFSIMDYTRNGLFFSPIFLTMGYLIYKNKTKYNSNFYLMGTFISISLLVTEALTLRSYDAQRHDSMYLMLIPCMFFLFNFLVCLRGKGMKNLRTICMAVYIIHPFSIVLVRAFAKLTNLETVFINNSIAHFVLVTLISFALGILFIVVFSKKPKIQSKVYKGRAWAEINLSNLVHNLRELKRILPQDCNVMAVVKANAYGHGAIAVSKELNRYGVNHFAVATASEGITLRKNGVRGEILVLGYTHYNEVQLLNRYKLTQTIIDNEYAKVLNSFGYKIKVHIKIDTGMNRLGERPEKFADILQMYKYDYLIVEGTYTHLCRADSIEERDIGFTRNQIITFYKIIDRLKQCNVDTKKLHIQSSYGVLNYPELKCDYARIGIALYGNLSKHGDVVKENLELRPMLSLKSRIALIKNVKKDETIGYGNNFITQTDCKIAVISIGYADGLPRNLSHSKSYILVNGQKAKIIGNICMDQLTADVTAIEDIKQGDIVTVIGQDRSELITAEMLAKASNTITNELLCRIEDRVNRISFSS